MLRRVYLLRHLLHRLIFKSTLLGLVLWVFIYTYKDKMNVNWYKIVDVLKTMYATFQVTLPLRIHQ